MNKCILKGYNCKYASGSGYCEIGNENCANEYLVNYEDVEDYLLFDEFDIGE